MSKQKSSIPVRHGFPNPAYGQALNFVRSVGDYRTLVESVRAAAQQQGGGLDFARLMRDCDANGVKDRLRQLFEQHQATPKVDPIMGPPPAAVELYGRFAKGTAIVDIGSGNCAKLRKATGYLTITAVDPNLENDARLVLNAVKINLARYLEGSSPDDIFTSFMSLPQIPYREWAPIVEHDGVHVVPDHRMLLANKIAVVQENGTLRVRTGVGDYLDYPMDLQGVPSEPGYMLCATFAKRNIQVTLPEKAERTSYHPIVDASPAGFYDLNFQDITPKFDGVAHELEVFGGVAHLVDRAGNQRIGACDAAFHFCIHLEELAECYTLIRIVAWRGIIFPHHGEVLRQFATRVSLFINDRPVLAPPRWDGAGLDCGPRLTWERGGHKYEYQPPVDGVISRERGRDLYCKMMWTVDIFHEMLPRIREVLAREGYELHVHGEPFDGLYECAMSRTRAAVVIKPLKPRVDKLIATTLDTILFLTDRPTLGETQLITESTYNV